MWAEAPRATGDTRVDAAFAAMAEYLAAGSQELAARGARAELFLVGGAALAVAYDATRATRDLANSGSAPWKRA